MATTHWMPDAIWKLSLSQNARALWALIYHRGGGSTAGCKLTNGELAKELEIPPRVLAMALKELRDKKVIRDDGIKGGKRSLFTATL